MIDPTTVASRVVEMVGDRAEAQATVAVGESALTRFANSFIHQNVADATRAITLKTVVDGRAAKATDNRVDDEALRDLVERTLEASRLSPRDPDWAGMTPPVELPDVEHFDRTTADATPEQRAAAVAEFIAAGEGTDAAGFCDTEAIAVGFANTLGHQAAGRHSRATLDGIHRIGTVAGSGHQTSPRFADIDGSQVGRLAAERLRLGADPYDIKPGEYEVILAPECVATIAIFLGVYGFNGKQVEEGQSFVDVGSRQFDDAIEIRDDPIDPAGLGMPFDSEGSPKRPLDLVSGGVTSAVVHDRRTARQAGVASTGHASPGSDLWGPMPDNLIVGAGTDTVEEMIAAIGRGLYVATFNYCRILDPKTMVVTGLTRNGTFMIENGAVTGAVTNLRFTQSFVEALGKGRVLGIGDDLRYAESEFGSGLVRAPSMRLASWHFTGGADG